MNKEEVLYSKLLEIVESDVDGKCYVYHKLKIGEFESNLNGAYEPKGEWDGSSYIQIFRPKRYDLFQDKDLLTLAHEYGHHLSYMRGEWSPIIKEVCNEVEKYGFSHFAELDQDKKDAVYNEEVRAWRYAKELLSEVGFDSWDWFNGHKEGSLYNYRIMFKKESLWRTWQ